MSKCRKRKSKYRESNKLDLAFFDFLRSKNSFLMSDFLIKYNKTNINYLTNLIVYLESVNAINTKDIGLDVEISYNGCIKDLNLYVDLVEVFHDVDILNRYANRLKICEAINDFILHYFYLTVNI